MGDNFSSLTNKEKTQIVIALKKDYKVSDILPIINLKKSTYFYEIKSLSKDKYKIEKYLITQLFLDNYECYGYRRIKESLFKEHGIRISEKVIRKLMKEFKLIVYVPKKAKYSWYKGEISPESENIIKRDFKANEPYSKSLTDITEFSLCDGKVYLSPLIDCFTGVPITYTIGKSPNSELTNTMLEQAHEIIGDSNMIVHSSPSNIKLIFDLDDDDFHLSSPKISPKAKGFTLQYKENEEDIWQIAHRVIPKRSMIDIETYDYVEYYKLKKIETIVSFFSKKEQPEYKQIPYLTFFDEQFIYMVNMSMFLKTTNG